MKKIYVVPQTEELPMEPMGGIMKTSNTLPSGTGGGSGAPARSTGDIIP